MTKSLKRSLKYRWVIFGILSLQYLLVYFHRVCPAVVAPELVKAFSISGTSLGILASGYFYPYALMQLPVGLFSDSWGPRKTVTGFTLLAAAGAILFGLAPNFGLATFSRVLVGFGLSAVFVPTMKVFAEWFKPREYARISGVLMAVGGIGWLTAATPLALMTEGFGWRGTFIAIGCFTALLSLLTWILVADAPQKGVVSPVKGASSHNAEEIRVLTGIRMVLTNRHFWPLAIWFFFVGGILFGFCGLWAGPYLMDIYLLSKASAGNILSMVAVGMIVGSPLLGYLSDKVLQSRKKVLVGASSLLLLEWVFFSLFYQTLPIPLLYLFFFLLGVCAGAIVVIAFTATKELFPIGIAGTSVGTVNLFPFAGGAIYQPLIGYLMDVVGKEGDRYLPQGYEMTFFFLLLTSLVAFISIFFVKERMGG